MPFTINYKVLLCTDIPYDKLVQLLPPGIPFILQDLRTLREENAFLQQQVTGLVHTVNTQAVYLEERDKTVMDLLQQVLTSVRTSTCPIVDPELLLQSAKHHAEQRSHASAPLQLLPAMSISPSTNKMPDNDAPSHQNQPTLSNNVTVPLQALEHAANEQPVYLWACQ